MRFLFCCCVSFVLRTTTADEYVVVQTTNGRVRGTVSDDVNAFLGVPYAKPPVDSLRWQRPQPSTPWSPAVYNATALQPGCPQHGCFDTNPAFVCPNKTSEDCLYLNIWTPSINTSLPVMVYIHGGNFVHLSASSPIFQGHDFVKKGKVVLVTFDYRLGVFGFLYTGSKPGDAEGNYGIRDQRLALQWVQQNIKYFGGDPTMVTLFGQSAGGQSIPVHLMAKDSKDLFRNVIIESAPFDIPFKTKTEATYLASTVIGLLNCTDAGDDYMSCLRSKSTDELAEAQHDSRTKPTSLKVLDFFEPLGPFVDGDVVPFEIITAIYGNKLRQVPTMIGTLSEEARIFVYEAWGKPLTLPEYIAVLFATYPSHLGEMLQQYPPSADGDNRDILTSLGTDFIFTCATRNMSRNFLKHGQTVHRYVFNHAFSFPGWGKFSYCEGHVCHGEEIAYVFHSADRSGFDFSADEERLSDELIAYWTNFAYTSDPNSGPHKINISWPTYDSNSTMLQFQTPKSASIQNYLKNKCDFWDSIGYSA
ncbi:cAMP-regulated D2 protein-like [Mya arenaria]|uniref:cAMP-regulated D2 protein-like n=1 Tax=Mya arenaria TaxID=6604 RepID=UPI0022E31AC9|nr:cAMP-regulated D2 protein-like [Mya arenaria]